MEIEEKEVTTYAGRISLDKVLPRWDSEHRFRYYLATMVVAVNRLLQRTIRPTIDDVTSAELPVMRPLDGGSM